MTAKQAVLGGDFDGQWLVFSVNSSPNEYNDWRLYAYADQTGHLLEVAHVESVNGKPCRPDREPGSQPQANGMDADGVPLRRRRSFTCVA